MGQMEYHARALAMEAVYWALGIHDPNYIAKYGEKKAVNKVLLAKAAWAVLSFRVVAANDPGVIAAGADAGIELAGDRRYYFDVFRWGKRAMKPRSVKCCPRPFGSAAMCASSGHARR
jgi:hypothetical protein